MTLFYFGTGRLKEPHILNPDNETYSQIQRTMAVTSEGSDASVATPVSSTSLDSQHLFKAGAGSLLSVSGFSSTSDGFLILLDRAAADAANGAIVPITTPLPVYAGQSSFAEWRAAAVPFTAGLVGVFSTNASPFVLTLGTNFFFSAQVR